MIECFNGSGISLGELKEFVDKCCEKYPNSTIVEIYSETNNEHAAVLSIRADEDSVCIYTDF